MTATLGTTPARAHGGFGTGGGLHPDGGGGDIANPDGDGSGGIHDSGGSGGNFGDGGSAIHPNDGFEGNGGGSDVHGGDGGSTKLAGGAEGALDSESDKPTVDDVILAITTQYPQYDPPDCIRMLTWLNEELLIPLRRENAYMVHPTTEQMAGPEYDMFDTIVPHSETPPVPGSTHDVLTRHVIDPARGENMLLHYQAVEGGRTFCKVALGLYV
ncbi:MAG: hypothetical protein WDN27_04045 [Candidatus Saccharibacteria bacterium]